MCIFRASCQYIRFYHHNQAKPERLLNIYLYIFASIKKSRHREFFSLFTVNNKKNTPWCFYLKIEHFLFANIGSRDIIIVSGNGCETLD